MLEILLDLLGVSKDLTCTLQTLEHYQLTR